MKSSTKIPILGMFTIFLILTMFLILNQVEALSLEKVSLGDRTIRIETNSKDPVIDVQLIENTDYCLSYCYAILRLRPYMDIKLPDSPNSEFKWDFVKTRQNMPGLKSYHFEILETIPYEVKIPVYEDKEYDCWNNVTEQNDVCWVSERTDYLKETKYKNEYKPFRFWGEILKANKDYYIKLIGKKYITLRESNIDWIPTIKGLEIREWAPWYSDWSYKRNITLKEVWNLSHQDEAKDFFIDTSSWSNHPTVFNYSSNCGDNQTCWTDIRISNESGDEISSVVYNITPSGTCNTGDDCPIESFNIFFNVTIDALDTKNYTIYYYNPEATEPGYTGLPIFEYIIPMAQNGADGSSDDSSDELWMIGFHQMNITLVEPTDGTTSWYYVPPKTYKVKAGTRDGVERGSIVYTTRPATIMYRRQWNDYMTNDDKTYNYEVLTKSWAGKEFVIPYATGNSAFDHVSFAAWHNDTQVTIKDENGTTVNVSYLNKQEAKEFAPVKSLYTITANNSISVAYRHDTDASYCNCGYSYVIYPKKVWGTEFYIPFSSPGYDYRYLEIIASENKTNVTVDGTSHIIDFDEVLTLTKNATTEEFHINTSIISNNTIAVIYHHDKPDQGEAAYWVLPVNFTGQHFIINRIDYGQTTASRSGAYFIALNKTDITNLTVINNSQTNIDYFDLAFREDIHFPSSYGDNYHANNTAIYLVQHTCWPPRESDGIHTGATNILDQHIWSSLVDYLIGPEISLINTPPTHDPPVLNSTYGTNFTGENLTCYNQSTYDADGDEVVNIYNWFIDNTPLNVLNMPFEGGSNDTYTKDYSGYGNDGTVSGATWTSPGKIGGAYEFDGSNDYIKVTKNFGTSFNAFSAEAWVNLKNTGTQYRYILERDDTHFYIAVSTDRKIRFRHVDLTTGSTETGANAIEFNEWTHIVAVYDGTKTYIYVNGEVEKEQTDTGTISFSASEPLYIGSSKYAPSYPDRTWNGTIDEIKIYNHALTPQQVYQNYLDTKDGFTNNRTIVSQETSGGETYKCEITPNDGYDDGITKQSNTLTVVWEIYFNVTSGEDGSSLNNVAITCSYTEFDQAGDTTNPYGPYGFPPGNYYCIFEKSGFFNKTITFTSNNDMTIDVIMSKIGALTFEEHKWLEKLYNCLYLGIEEDCEAFNLLQIINQTNIYMNQTMSQINETLSKIWSQFKRTDQSVVTHENIYNKNLSGNANLTINYSVNVPIKEGYIVNETSGEIRLDFLPIRISYWFLNYPDNGSCYKQGDVSLEGFEVVEPYCIPLVAYTVGQVNSTLNFTVELRPSLPEGEYTIVRNIEIDPEQIWINYGREAIGVLKVHEANEKPMVSIKITSTQISTPTAPTPPTGWLTGNITSFITLFSIISLGAIGYLILNRRKRYQRYSYRSY